MPAETGRRLPPQSTTLSGFDSQGVGEASQIASCKEGFRRTRSALRRSLASQRSASWTAVSTTRSTEGAPCNANPECFDMRTAGDASDAKTKTEAVALGGNPMLRIHIGSGFQALFSNGGS